MQEWVPGVVQWYGLLLRVDVSFSMFAWTVNRLNQLFIDSVVLAEIECMEMVVYCNGTVCASVTVFKAQAVHLVSGDVYLV